MRNVLTILFLLPASQALSAARQLSGPEIAALLPAIMATSAATRQTFGVGGSTTFTDHGRDSIGSWEVRGDQYCSQWPPALGWACFDVSVEDEPPARIIWTGESGKPLVNELRKKD